jgi:hypothetical protein
VPTGTNPIANAIRRAHREGQRELARFLEAQETALLELYRRAGEILQAEIQQAANAEGVIGVDQVRRLRRIVDEILDDLNAEASARLDTGMERMAELGIRPFQGQPLEATTAQLTEQVMRGVRTFQDANGLQLSDRLWRLDASSRRTIRQHIETAVAEGQSASRAAQDYVLRNEPIPDDVLSRRERAKAQAIALKARNELDGGQEYRKALQVMRTESVRAHGMAHRAAAAAHPDVAGVQFRLSPNHPRVDICDVHASANIYGLGPGVYPPDRSPWPAHPNTMSYEQVVFRDEVTDEDRSGKQSRIDWLGDQPDSIVLPALGGSEAKLRAFRAGHLTERSIATPWSKLRESLKRKGVDVERFEG